MHAGNGVSTGQKQAKKCSTGVMNKHVKPVFNATMATRVINQGLRYDTSRQQHEPTIMQRTHPVLQK